MADLTEIVDKLRTKAQATQEKEELRRSASSSESDSAQSGAGKARHSRSGTETDHSANPGRSSSGHNTDFEEDIPFENRSRFREIRAVLSRNKITRGVTPEKLRIILEELGPTYVKLGQIMSLHSDILPEAYCKELMKLNYDVAPMSFEEVEQVINKSYGCSWTEYFSDIDPVPIGSASIAQVHKAHIKDPVTGKPGDEVILKVRRRGIYTLMSRDIQLLHRIVRLMPPVGDLKNLVDLDMVLDEMWAVAQEEMNFLIEAANMEEFARNNKDVRYVGVPKLYKEYTHSHVLVMEYIDGFAIDDKKDLLENGYDLNEIGEKFVNNFIRQVMDDGFFHADPHPGNVKIRGGKIIWIDMGMMGRLTDRDRRIMVRGVQGIAMHDIRMVENAVLDLGDFEGKPDQEQLYNDLKEFLQRYGSASMGNIDVAETMQSLMEIMKTNHIRLPHGMTMLCRGLTHMQGVLASISPDISMFQIATTRLTEDYLSNVNWRGEFSHQARQFYRAVNKGIEIPSLTNDALKEWMAGEGRMHLMLHCSPGLAHLINSAVRNLVIGLCIAALLIASSIICTTGMQPQVYGIPVLGAAGFIFALACSIFLTIRYIYRKVKGKP